ncbi:MAG: GNAT family N-acetyltransferase [Planctomycetota bacterium]
MEILAPHPKRHREAMIDLWCKIFGFGDNARYFNGRAFCEEGYLDGSHYDWNASRIGMVDGQIVAHYGVWGYDMRVGTATIRCGGIGAVCTHPDHRKRGYLLRVANASIDAMRDEGYDVSLLFGINDFYDRVGYVRAFSYRQHAIETEDLPTAEPVRPSRKFKLVRREDTDRLYNRTFAGQTGTAVRPTFRRAGDIRGEGYSWRDDRDRLAGYVYVEDDRRGDRLKCYEAVGDPEQLLRVLGRLARRRSFSSVALMNQPRATKLIQRVEAERCEITTRLNVNGGPMARSINLASTLTKVADVLHTRLRGSSLSKWRGTLLVDDGDEKVSLRIGARGVTAGEPVKTPHVLKTKGHAVQLVWGTDDPATLMQDAGMKATGDAAALAAALFPAQDPMLLTFDHF